MQSASRPGTGLETGRLGSSRTTSLDFAPSQPEFLTGYQRKFRQTSRITVDSSARSGVLKFSILAKVHASRTLHPPFAGQGTNETDA